MIPPSAATHVFDLPELLELILWHLSIPELLQAQRVSKTFRLAIATAPRLQRALFFRPVRDPLPSAFNNHHLMRAFPAHYPRLSLKITTFLGSQFKSQRPWQRTWSVHLSLDSHRSSRAYIPAPTDSPPLTRGANWMSGTTSPKGSWRQMHLSQPPCTELYLTKRSARSPTPVLVNKAGITMGELCDAVALQNRLFLEQQHQDDERESCMAETRISTLSLRSVGNGEHERPVELWPEDFIGLDRDWHFEGVVMKESI